MAVALSTDRRPLLKAREQLQTSKSSSVPHETRTKSFDLLEVGTDMVWYSACQFYFGFNNLPNLFFVCADMCWYVLIRAPGNNGVYKYRNNVFRCNHSFWNGLKVWPVNRQRGRSFCPNKKPADERITLYWRQVAIASFCCRRRILFWKTLNIHDNNMISQDHC